MGRAAVSVVEKGEEISEWIAEERIDLIDLGSLQIKPCRLIRYLGVRTGYSGSVGGRAVIVGGKEWSVSGASKLLLFLAAQFQTLYIVNKSLSDDAMSSHGYAKIQNILA